MLLGMLGVALGLIAARIAAFSAGVRGDAGVGLAR